MHTLAKYLPITTFYRFGKMRKNWNLLLFCTVFYADFFVYGYFHRPTTMKNATKNSVFVWLYTICATCEQSAKFVLISSIVSSAFFEFSAFFFMSILPFVFFFHENMTFISDDCWFFPFYNVEWWILFFHRKTIFMTPNKHYLFALQAICLKRFQFHRFSHQK